MMRLREILTDRTMRELTPRGTPLFPLEMYCNDISEFPMHYVPWHWHEELELGYVLNGSMMIESDGSKAELSPGDGFFINSNQLHAMRPADNASCETVNIVFAPEIIAGAPHSIYESKFVLPLTAGSEVGVALLRPSVEWQNGILKRLEASFHTYTEASYGYEIQIRNDLSQIWLSLFRALVDPAEAGRSSSSPRIKNILTYIHENYMYPVTLEQIAQSANIGVRTCYRWFRRQIGMTPFEYLMEYRVKIAAALLSGTDKTVTDISFEAGFNNTSYFSKIFRKATGYTPSAFRKKQEQP